VGHGSCAGRSARCRRIPRAVGPAGGLVSRPGGRDAGRVAQGIAGRERLRFERYQQKFGEAEVLGGQLTIYRAASGEAVAVIGNHFPAINALNTARLNAGQAQAIAARQLGGEGEWKSRLMIDASKGRYFFEVENRRSDSRWFYWVDAETGDIVNAYDGLTHGSGTGVQGDTKDLTGLTTLSGGKYELISSDGRQTTYDAGNRNRLPGSIATDSDDFWNTAGRTSPGQAALVDAQFYAKVTDNYLKTHGFNWVSHYPQGMVSSAHLPTTTRTGTARRWPMATATASISWSSRAISTWWATSLRMA